MRWLETLLHKFLGFLPAEGFAKWWIILCLQMMGGVVVWYHNGYQFLWENDITKLTFVILGLFAGATVSIGGKTLRSSHAKKANVFFGRFVSGALLDLGMIGTVVGFIIMLFRFTGNFDLQNHEMMMKSIADMASGMSVAFLTTLTGLVTSLCLKMQLINFDIMEWRNFGGRL